MNTFFPSQIGYIPTGNAAGALTSTVVVGRTITGVFEAVGFGQGGRPDYVEVVQVNISKRQSVGGGGAPIVDQYGTITMNVADIITARAANSHFPTNLNMTFKEVAICENGTNKRFMVLASQTYAVP